ncbi:hypothetical protein FHT39_000848 [Mitsuaria sp. BK045]|uniref:P-loop ATPase, Sll1717 family n=1 Tax=unclassified Roseateles TaxID=2626991 RepID=UPI0016216A8D|nr:MULTISPECIES: hypothetical protein [unclassified Roseateles]MBB3292209.1 hypothetical protein [Mitsuaria sp. BK041]MBB3361426.1 hypothetical protein [Mitsuaria sp. BK045]
MADKESKKWLPVVGLREPFNDAVNYKTRQEKEFFSQIFLKTSDVSAILGSSIYYLIGEKGSGKTAYAVYLDNNTVEDTRCRLSTMTETQYKRFIALKKKGQLEYSDYANIWRPMLLNMMAQALVAKSKGFLQSVTGKFDAVEQEIERFNEDSLNPEVEVAFEMTAEANTSLSVGNDKALQASAKDLQRSVEKSQSVRHHLLETETRLKGALGDLRLARNHVLFVDGIDYRPEDVPYGDYLECVKGLGEAVWQLNNDFFANIRDSRGRMKVVLLVRPDVFHKLNLYNSNSRLRDNSVLLDWSTTELALRDSRLYEATGKFFSSQQGFLVTPIEAADNYFNSADSNTIFKRLLRTTFQKPRDLLTFIKIARRIHARRGALVASTSFESQIVRDPDYTKEYADYLLGEVRDYSDFYMTPDDFQLYVKFFQYLNGKTEFSFDEFSAAYKKFKAWISGEKLHAVEYIRDPEALLQFFFDVNVIGYREEMGNEREKFVHFSFRERTLNNIAPKVKVSAILVVNPGVAKALDIGLRPKLQESAEKELRRRRRNKSKRSHPRPTASIDGQKFGRAMPIASASSKAAPSGRSPIEQGPQARKRRNVVKPKGGTGNTGR